MQYTIKLLDDMDGYTHQVCSQNQFNSCAAASLFTVECYRKQKTMVGGEQRILDMAGRGAETLHSGLDYDVISRLLAQWGGVTMVEGDYHGGKGLKINVGNIDENHPAFVVVYWYNSKGKIDGAHAVVARWPTDDMSRIVFLDPWKGQLVHLVNDGNFRSQSGRGKIGRVYYSL